MKSFGLIVLSVILSVSATPLGDRVAIRRHNGVPLSRRYVLQSRTTAPAACAAVAPAAASGTTATPDPSATDIPVADPTASDNSTVTAVPAVPDNSTVTADPTVADNSTAAAIPAAAPADNSTAAANTTATRRSTRFWARGHHGFDGGFVSSSSFSEHESISFSFEEEVSTFVETWEDLCISSGGDIFTNDPCNLATADALLETADPCDQQVIADSMITFAKSEGIVNRDDLFNFAFAFRKHARRSVEILGVLPSSLYCLETPVNSELVGIYNDQFEGCNPGLFGSPSTPLVPFGSSGTCPAGMTADVDTCGCVGSDGTVDDGSADTTDSTDTSTDTSADSSADSTDASSTDTADATLSTDSASTDASSTDTADAAAITAPPTATDAIAATSFLSGPNAQPTDISGDVNDPEGRR